MADLETVLSIDLLQKDKKVTMSTILKNVCLTSIPTRYYYTVKKIKK